VTTATTPRPARPTQADRRARTRGALLEAAARGLSRHGYGNLVLERVANEAGYSRGALYHLFANKEELALAVVDWVEETWYERMAPLMTEEDDPAGALVAIAREHAIFCRRDIARVAMTLRVEFSGQDHPVGRAVERAVRRVVRDCAALVEAARANGTVPAGPSARILAMALTGAVEGVVIDLAGQEPYDAELAEAAARGVLGLAPEASRAAR
jgi:AcrR family transcriptional regulator